MRRQDGERGLSLLLKYTSLIRSRKTTLYYPIFKELGQIKPQLINGLVNKYLKFYKNIEISDVPYVIDKTKPKKTCSG